MKTLAIFSPNQNAYSETFIQSHRNLPFEIKYYYDGDPPTKLEGYGDLYRHTLNRRIGFRIQTDFSLQEYALKRSLIKENIDIVLAEYGPTACATLKVLQHLNIPMVVHFHGYDASAYSTLECYGKQYKKVFEYACQVIAVSQKMKSDLINLGCAAEKITTLRYGAHSSFFEISADQQGSQFIAVGRFVEKKAPHLLLLAFSKVVKERPDAKLVMAGEGPLLESSKTLVKALGLFDNVCFAGVLSTEEIRNLMASSVAFVQHSIVAENGDAEGTPVAILEAQASGLPVISTLHAGIPEVVHQDQSGILVRELDIDEMAIAMLRILDNKNLAKQMGNNARKNARQNFTMEQYLGGIEAIIRNCKG